ncbi:MAG: Ig-like domain-containing protein [Cyclobacteriaceae bacterium]
MKKLILHSFVLLLLGGMAYGQAPVITQHAPAHGSINQSAQSIVIEFDQDVEVLHNGNFQIRDANDLNIIYVDFPMIRITHPYNDNYDQIFIHLSNDLPHGKRLTLTFPENSIYGKNDFEYWNEYSHANPGEYYFTTATSGITDVTKPTLSKKFTWDGLLTVDEYISGDFSENVIGGAGKIYIREYDTDNIVEEIPASQVIHNQVGMRLIPTFQFETSTHYYLDIEAGAFLDLHSNAYDGLSSKSDWDFTTISTDNAPAVTLVSTHSTPTAGALRVNPNDPLELVFTDDIFLNGNSSVSTTFKIYARQGSEGFTIRSYSPLTSSFIDITDNKMTITPTQGLIPEGHEVYIAIASSGLDHFEEIMAGNWYFSTLDLTDPDIFSFSPEAGGEATDVEEDLIVTFNENIQLSTGTIQLFREGSLVETFSLPSSSKVSVTDRTLTIDPTTNLSIDGAVYHLTISSGAVQDLSGRSFAGISDNSTWSFEAPDQTGPVVQSLSPANGATDVTRINNEWTINFNEPINRHVHNDIYIKEVGTGNILATAYSANSDHISVSSNVFEIKSVVTSTIEYGTEVYVEIPTNFIIDEKGNFFGGIAAGEWQFTIEEAANTAPTDISLNATSIEEGNAVNAVVGTLSTTDADAGDTHTYSLVSGTGSTDNASFNINGSELRASEIFDYETKSSYSILVETNDGTATFQKQFTITVNEDDVDETAPVLVSRNPENDAVNVDVDLSTITITFDEPVQYTGNSAHNVYLREYLGGETIIKQFDFSNTSDVTISGNTVTLSNFPQLEQKKRYYFQMQTANAIEDLAGNDFQYTKLGNKLEWNFTIEDITPPTTNWFSPVIGEQSHPVPSYSGTGLVIEFNEYIQLGTGTIALHKADGTLVKSYAVPGTDVSVFSGSRLKISTYKNTIPTTILEYDTEYYVIISDGAVIDNSGNGYAGISDDNFWTFKTEEEPDNTPPVASSTSPSDEGTYAPLSATGGIVFNENIVEGDGTIALYLADGTLLESIPTGQNDPRLETLTFRITWDFNTQLTELTDYYVLVSAGAYQDEAGNDFGGIGPGELDFTSNDAPNIASLSPANQSTGVGISSTITVDFDGTVYAADPSTLVLKEYATDNTIESFDLTILDTGDGMGSFDDGVITVTPTSDLEESTKYYLVLEPALSIRYEFNAESFIGLDDKDDWTFTTQAADIEAPTLTSSGAISGGTYGSAILNFTLTFSEEVNFNTGDGDFNVVLDRVNSVASLNASITETTSNSISFEYEYLDNGEDYHITIEPNVVTDLAGNPFEAITTSDVLPFLASWDSPEISSYSPGNFSSQADVAANLVLTFDRDIAFTDLTGDRIFLKYITGGATVEAFELSSSRVSIQNGNQLVIDPTDDLELSQNYFVTILSPAITTSGQEGLIFGSFNSNNNWRFRTEPNFWDGSTWAADAPISTDEVAFKADYDFTEGEVLEVSLVYLHEGVTLSIENNATLRSDYIESEGSLVIESGASLNIQESFEAGENSDITVKRYTSGSVGEGKYSFIGSPFANYDFSTIAGGFKYQYVESSDSYVDASSDLMSLGKGYTIANNEQLEFVGQLPQVDNVYISIRNTGADKGYNLVANPYTCAISYEELIAAEGPGGSGKITSTIYIWDDGGAGTKNQSDFITISALGSVSGGSGRSADFNDHIGVAQAFFVEAVNASTSLSFTNAMKVNGQNSDDAYFRKDTSTPETIKMALSNDQDSHSEIIVGWAMDASTGYDIMYDARKMIGNDLSQLYMPLGERNLAIQGLPDQHNQPVALGVDIKAAGDYQLEVIESATSRNMILVDHQLDVTHDLSSSSYSFYSQAGKFDSRFEIVAGGSAILSTSAVSKFTAYSNNNELTIHYPETGEHQVRVLDLSGKLVYQANVNFDQQKVMIPLPLDEKIYLLQVDSESLKVFNH